MFRLASLFILLTSVVTATASLRAEKCEPIPDENSPTGYAKIAVTQEEAQKKSHDHHNMILKMATKFLNNHFSDISSVEIEYDGHALSGHIGKYIVTAYIQRSIEGSERSECHTIDYWVEDIDECELNTHKCGPTTVCTNTIGSYECSCPDGFNGVEGSGSVRSQGKSGICGGNRDTSYCCSETCLSDHSASAATIATCLSTCKSNFHCSDDPCTDNRCHAHATCIADSVTHTYECLCNEGYTGDGFSCEEYVAPDYCEAGHSCLSPCECVNDFDQNGYRCVAPRGYVTAHNPFETAVPPDHFSLNPENVSLLTAPVHATLARRLDENMCFSRDGMDLSLDGPNPSLYQQGDSYEEHGLQVSDHQPENFVRRVSIHYSSPLGSIFWEPNTHYVYYTVQTPWLPLKANITKTRKVVVNDVDECSYTGDVERFRHKCSPEARCVNTHGSYSCECAVGYEGDGIRKKDGSSGCLDVRPPVLQCSGKGCSPMVFKAVSVVGIMSVDTGITQLDEGTDLAFIETFLEKHKYSLCTSEDPCYTAYDEVASGVVPLTNDVFMGNVTHITRSHRHITFKVPYSVRDEAGNSAGPLNLTLEVELVDVKDHLSGALISVRKQDYFGVFTFVLTIVVILCAAYLSKIIRAIRVALHAIQFAMYPYTLMARRRDFEEGMDLVLQVMSLGMMTKTDRMRRIATKWNSLVETMDSDKEEDDN